MPNPNDADAMVQWIFAKVETDPGAILLFLQSGKVLAEALEHFNNDWIDYCKENFEEPPFPYQTAVYSRPQAIFEDVHGDETGDYMDLNPGTLIEVIRKNAIFRDLRLCRIANGDPDQYFWLDIEEIRYEE